MRKSVLTIILVFMFLSSLPIKADSNNFYQDPELRIFLSQSVLALEKQAKHIQEQYVSITSRLSKLEYEIPEKIQCLSNLCKTADINFRFDDNANIYYDAYDIEEFENFMFFAAADRSVPNSDPSPFATLEQLLAVSNQVVTLSGSLSSLSSNLTSLQNTVNSILASQTSLQNSLQSLTVAYNLLNEQCNNLTSAVQANDDGSVVIAKSSPLVGRTEPTSGANYWQPAIDGNWDRAGNTFRVSRDTQLESVTLYCDNVTRILSTQNVYITACKVNSGLPQIIEYAASSINTSDFPRITYSFSPPVQISADRDYLLCVKRTGNAPLYVYTCSNIRYGDFYKPYGASDEPRGGSDPPRSGITPQQFFYEYLSDCWSLTYTTQDIWSIFKFSDDESFTFNENGFEVESGYITVGGAEVVTSSTLKDMFVSALTNNPSITWDMFGQELTNKIITTAGGTVTGTLTVSTLILPNNGNWLIGTPTNRTDIVISHQEGCITTLNGDLNLAANGGGGKIKAMSFFELEEPNQCGKKRIMAGSDSAIIATNLTDDAVISITPAQRVDFKYWVEIDEFGTALIKLSDETNEDLLFYFTIMKQ
jgi:hypothetical protein